MYKLLFAFLFSVSFLVAQDTITFKLGYLPKIDTVLVFTPKIAIQKGESFSVTFLLHGWSGGFSDWEESLPKYTKNKIKSLQDLADQFKTIIVCPDGFYAGWYWNSPVLKNSQYENFFFDTLYPEIVKKDKVDPTRIYITGLSMGGHGALTLFLKHPEKFAAAASMSGILNLVPFNKNWGMSDIFGHHNDKTNNYSKYSATTLINSYKNIRKPLFIDCGTGDFAYKVNLEFETLCKKNNLIFDSRFAEGVHNWEYWVVSLPLHLEFFKRSQIVSQIVNDYY